MKSLKKFNFNGRYLMLTYKTHLTKEQFRGMLTKNDWIKHKPTYKIFNEKG